MNVNKTVVVAKFKEDTNWVESLPCSYFIVEKGKHLPNEGRESLSYLWYIIENWSKLNGTYVFMQGNPTPHWFNYKNELDLEDFDFTWRGQSSYNCRKDGVPQHSGLAIEEFAKEANISLPEDNNINFVAGGQFIVTAKKIKSKGKKFYKKLYEMHTTYKKAPWIMERLWGYIFK